MGITSQILGNAGSPYRLMHDGKTYEFRFIDQTVKDAWEKALFERKCQKLDVLRGSLAPEDYSARRAKLEDDLDRDEFSFLAPQSVALIQTVPGVMMLLPLLVGRDINELIALVAARKEEVVAIVNRVIRESFPGVRLPEPAPAGEGVPTQQPGATVPN